MRDWIFLGFLLAMVPVCFARPWIGGLVWAWVGLMNPHRYTFGIAYTFPVAKVVGAATLSGILFTKDKLPLPRLKETWLLFLIAAMFTITTFFAVHQDDAWKEWDRFSKIFLMTIAMLWLFQDRSKIRYMLYVISLSVGFFGIKGGIFSLLTGGEYRVGGPQQSFLEENNALALAELMIIPILFTLAQEQPRKWIRWGLYVAAGLNLFAVFFSYSRGALLAMTTLGLMALLRSKKKGTFAVLAALVVCAALLFLPEKWFDRMHTIKTYDEDASAMGRINAWWFAYNVAKASPFLGAGFEAFKADLFRDFAPNPWDVHDAHSIYFQVLGEHGFVALGIFVALLAGTILSLRRVDRMTAGVPELEWASRYSRMLEMSLVCFAVGGAFLGLAYFDLYYYLIAMAIVVKAVAMDRLSRSREAPSTSPGAARDTPARGVPKLASRHA